MQVRLAKTAGFCMGVRRAMGRVLDASATTSGRLVTYGPLIHNRQVVRLLETRQVTVVSSPEEVQPGDRVAVRAHGIPPDTRQALLARGATLCDATCPHVARAQGLVKRAALKGRDVIIVGDRGHAEVVGLLGFSQGRGYVVERPEDLDGLPDLEDVAVVAQTTQSEDLFGEVERRVLQRYPRCEVFNTICGSTSERQREAAELSADVDVMVVVGGRHSANTVRLVQVAGQTGKPVIHVETADELRQEDFAQRRVVGVTAGASTPNWIIEEVVVTLEGFHAAGGASRVGGALGVLHLLARSGAISALGAGGLAFATTEMLGIPFRGLYFAIAAAYVYSMVLWNAYAEVRSGGLVDRPRVEFLRRHPRVFSAVASALAVGSLVLSSFLGLHALLLLLVSATLGILYTIPLFPRSVVLRYRRLKDLPGSRNIFYAGAVGAVAAGIPALDDATHVAPLAACIPLLFVTVLAIVRSVVIDVKDMQSDIFAGRETLPVLIGTKGTKLVLATLIVLAAAAIVTGSQLEWLTTQSLWQLPTLGLISGVLFVYQLRLIEYGVLFHWLLELSFLLAGLMALVGRIVG